MDVFVCKETKERMHAEQNLAENVDLINAMTGNSYFKWPGTHMRAAHEKDME